MVTNATIRQYFATMHYSYFIPAAFAAALTWAIPHPPTAAPTDCTSAPLPTIISTPGCFRVSEDFTTDQDGQWAIQVKASDVHIDLDGHTLTGAGENSSASGIEGLNAANLTVSGGNITDFLYGIRVQNDDDHPGPVTVENVAVSGGARGVYLTADQVVVRDSTFSEMPGYAGWPASHTIGIEVFADECSISGNELHNLYPYSVGEVVAISLSAPAEQCQVVGNVVRNDEPPEYGRGIAFWVTPSQSQEEGSSVIVAANSVTGYAYAFMTSVAGRPVFQRNTFTVDCGPAIVKTYDGAVELNTFVEFDDVCGDSVSVLEELAKGGEPEWNIRLAAALIEGQWRVPPEGDRCSHMKRAEAILTPLAEAGITAAADQMRRLMPSVCD